MSPLTQCPTQHNYFFIYTAHSKAKDKDAKAMDIKAKAAKFGLKAKALTSLLFSEMWYILDCFCTITILYTDIFLIFHTENVNFVLIIVLSDCIIAVFKFLCTWA